MVQDPPGLPAGRAASPPRPPRTAGGSGVGRLVQLQVALLDGLVWAELACQQVGPAGNRYSFFRCA